MKVKKVDKKFRTLTLRIDENVMLQIDDIAEENGISRQKLVESILKQVLADKRFVLAVE